MKYAEMLQNGITAADLTLAQICRRLPLHGVKATRTYLSKLQQGKVPPARDELNLALASVLFLNPLDFNTAAYLERIPPEVIDRIKSMV